MRLLLQKRACVPCIGKSAGAVVSPLGLAQLGKPKCMKMHVRTIFIRAPRSRIPASQGGGEEVERDRREEKWKRGGGV